MLEGQISKYQLFNVYTQLAKNKSIGTLFLRNRKHNSALYFQEGKIIFANANITKDRIGELLVRDNRIKREHLEEALVFQRNNNNKVRIGSILIQNYNLDPDALIQGIKRQIVTVIEDLFLWSDMTYQFLENVFPSEEKITFDMSVENIILKESRQVTSWDLIKDSLPDFNSVLQLTELEKNYTRNVELLAEEWNILRLVNGYSTIREIYQNSNKSEFDVCKILYRLISSGLIERVSVSNHTKLSHLEKKIDRLSRLLSGNLKENTDKDEEDLIDFGEC